MTVYTKRDITELISKGRGITIEEARQQYDNVIGTIHDVISSSVKNSEEIGEVSRVRMTGVGTVIVKRHKARKEEGKVTKPYIRLTITKSKMLEDGV